MLLDGTYTGTFLVQRAGIEIRSLHSRMAIIDGGIRCDVDGVTFRELEIMCSSGERLSAWNTYGDPPDVYLPTAINLYGSNCSVINCVIHDNKDGIFNWAAEENTSSLIYGNVIYNCGLEIAIGWTGHGIYAQNKVGNKIIQNNIFMNQFGINQHLFGSGATQLNNFTIQGNISANGTEELAGGAVINHAIYDSNVHYRGALSFGWTPGDTDVTISNNTIWRANSWVVYFCDQVNTFGNVVRSCDVVIDTLTNTQWNNNAYSGCDWSVDHGAHYITDFAVWQTATGYDANSTNGAPLEDSVQIFKNDYEIGRAHIAVLNHSLAESVDIDLSSVCTVGESYLLHSMQAFREDITTFTYDGISLTVDMRAANRPVTKPLGWSGDWRPNIFPECGIFLLERAI